jgi:hypothetical protein
MVVLRLNIFYFWLYKDKTGVNCLKVLETIAWNICAIVRPYNFVIYLFIYGSCLICQILYVVTECLVS